MKCNHARADLFSPAFDWTGSARRHFQNCWKILLVVHIDASRYNQADLERVVSEARDRGIRVIPELDSPAHVAEAPWSGAEWAVAL